MKHLKEGIIGAVSALSIATGAMADDAQSNGLVGIKKDEAGAWTATYIDSEGGTSYISQRLIDAGLPYGTVDPVELNEIADLLGRLSEQSPIENSLDGCPETVELTELTRSNDSSDAGWTAVYKTDLCMTDRETGSFVPGGVGQAFFNAGSVSLAPNVIGPDEAEKTRALITNLNFKF